eukprot:6209533-Pleurochrysis_carterae.AAC.3
MSRWRERRRARKSGRERERARVAETEAEGELERTSSLGRGLDGPTATHEAHLAQPQSQSRPLSPPCIQSCFYHDAAPAARSRCDRELLRVHDSELLRVHDCELL